MDKGVFGVIIIIGIAMLVSGFFVPAEGYIISIMGGLFLSIGCVVLLTTESNSQKNVQNLLALKRRNEIKLRLSKLFTGIALAGVPSFILGGSFVNGVKIPTFLLLILIGFIGLGVWSIAMFIFPKAIGSKLIIVCVENIEENMIIFSEEKFEDAEVIVNSNTYSGFKTYYKYLTDNPYLFNVGDRFQVDIYKHGGLLNGGHVVEGYFGMVYSIEHFHDEDFDRNIGW